MRTPKAILFDIGSTLWTEHEFDADRGTEHVLSLASDNPKAVTSDIVIAMRQEIVSDLLERRERSWFEMSPYIFHRHVFEPCGLRFDMTFNEIEREFWQAATRIEAMDGALDAVKRVGELDLGRAVISNSAITGATLRWQLDQLGFAGEFEFIMSSADYGVRKPHPLIFLTAARKLGLAPNDVWYVGDSIQHDIQGAKSAGMTAVWFNPNEQEATVKPDAVIYSWSEFESLIT